MPKLSRPPIELSAFDTAFTAIARVGLRSRSTQFALWPVLSPLFPFSSLYRNTLLFDQIVRAGLALHNARYDPNQWCLRRREGRARRLVEYCNAFDDSEAPLEYQTMQMRVQVGRRAEALI